MVMTIRALSGNLLHTTYRFALLLPLLLVTLLTGCSTTNINNLHQHTVVSTPIEKKYYHVDIPSFDGTTIKATVFQPALNSYESAPLIIHAHGFGTWRMKGKVGLHGTFMVHGKAGLKAWDEGYWVISIDHRGFGASGGKVGLMNPDVEVRDASAVVDWAVDNLPRLSFDDRSERDPKIGMLGESYGGQMQLLASIKDPRIDAIIPMTTWHNLGEALAPNGHLKSFWTMIFFGAGTLSSRFDMNEVYKKEYMASMGGTITPELQEFLYKRSMAAFCEQGEYIQADALFIQGFRDTIFPLNHALDNHACAKLGKNAKSGKPVDTRLLVMQGGHLLPTQKWTGLPIFNTEKTIHCEDQQIGLTQVMVDWFDAKLKGKAEKVAHVPELCMTQDYDEGIVTDALPVGGEEIIVERNTVRPGFSGLLEVIARPFDWVTSIPKSMLGNEKLLSEIEADSKQRGGLIRPAFMPLKVADKKGVLVGIPTAELYLESENDEATVFAAIGIKKPNSNQVRIISEQVIPLVGRGYHTVDLPGMSSSIERGDAIGLVVYGTSVQYFLNRSYMPSETTVSGLVSLPLLRKSGSQYVAYSSPDPIQNIAANDVVISEDENALSAVSLPNE